MNSMDTECKIAQMILFTNFHSGSLKVLSSFQALQSLKSTVTAGLDFVFGDGIPECFIEVLSHTCTKQMQKIYMKNEK